MGVLVGAVLLAVAAVVIVVRPATAPAGLSVADAGSVAATSPTGDPAARAGTTPSEPGTAGVTGPGSGSTPALPAEGSVPPLPADSPIAPSSTGPVAGAPVTTLSAPPVGRAPEPASVSFPDLAVEAPVVTVGVDAAGLMEVPPDVATVGWYGFGPAPGATAGSAVLTGHVDDADQGPGVFAALGRLEPGDPIEVTDVDGIVRRFEVVARESWPKDEVPLDRLFQRTGPARLVLITCGGAFDPAASSYEENIAVTASPLG